MNRFQCLLIAGAMMLLSGCHSDSEVSKVTDESSTQADPAALAMLGELEVTDALGEKRMVADFSQGKNLVVVVSRGYYGSVCPYCSAQVQRLAYLYDDIAEAGGHVLVIFPVEQIDDFTHRSALVEAAKSGLADAASKLPFEIVSDPELNAVDQLNIRAELSKPATYILDTAGKVRYAYVGRDPGDRPKVTSIIRQLESIKG